MQTELAFGPGVGDLQRIALREVERIMKEARGDRTAAVRIAIGRAGELGFVTAEEAGRLAELADLGFAAASGRLQQADAHARSRELLDAMLAEGRASAAALAFAAGSSHAEPGPPAADGSPGVVFRKASSNWQDTLGGAGAVIGGVIGGGPSGAAFGAALGQVVGKIVDECIVEE